MECPLVQLGKYRKLLKKFEEAGMVALPASQWLLFFEALAFIYRESRRGEIYCTIAGGCVVFSQTPIKRRVDLRPDQIELFDG